MPMPRQNNFFDTCSQCKTNYDCCHSTRPPITPRRRKTIEEYLKDHKIPIENPFAQTDYLFRKEKTDGYCIFQDENTKKCLIHPVKPETCVAGPVTFDINKQSQKIEWYLKTEKLCPLSGAMHKNKEALQKHLATAKREINKLVDELDPEELKGILRIEEPETFKIDEDPLKKETLDRLTRD